MKTVRTFGGSCLLKNLSTANKEKFIVCCCANPSRGAEIPVAVKCRLIPKENRGQRCARLFTHQPGTEHCTFRHWRLSSKRQMSTKHFIMQDDTTEVVFQLKTTCAINRDVGGRLCAERSFKSLKLSEVTPVS